MRAFRQLRVAAAAAALALFGFAVSAGASSAPASLAVGGAPPAIAARALGSLAAATPLRLTVVLVPRNRSRLAAAAASVSTPGSPTFHHYLSTSEFAAEFGASHSSVAQLRAFLRGHGLTPGPLARDGLSLSVSGSAARASRAFDVTLRRYRENSGREVYSNTAAPRVPASLRGVVADVLGLDDVPAAAPAGLVAGSRAPVARAASSGGGAPAACPAASAAAGSSYFTINQIAHAYGIDGLYARGDFGAGVTVALDELELYPTQDADVAAFGSCYGIRPNVLPDIQIDGGPIGGTDAPTSAETAVDIENLVGLAPSVTVQIYQGPDTDAGILDTLSGILDAPPSQFAQVISDSWVLCESARNDGNQSMIADEGALFDQAAVQGQTVLASAGDRGSAGCVPLNDPNHRWGETPGPLAVEDPASQPEVTGVGGTSLYAEGPPPSETSWNDLYIGAGGGGISSAWGMPDYQRYSGVPGIFSSYSSGTPCAAGTSGYCREVPDVSVDAAPATGYVTYYNSGWHGYGGTSTAAPVWAAVIALADASGMSGCSPKTPLGFANPLLYYVAAGPGYADAFNDITVGDNNQFGSGAYPATAGYDMASGLGTPRATDGTAPGSPPGLVAQLCAAAQAPSVPAPSISGVSVPGQSAADAAPGTTVTIDGANFTPFTRVWFGSQQASGVTLTDSGHLQAIVPPFAGAGVVDVTATTLSGQRSGASTSRSAASSADLFTYAPSVSISTPASGAAYTQGQTLTAAYACSVYATGASSCSASVANGAAIDTSSLGTHQFSVTATDANGVATTSTSTYTVIAPPSVNITGPAPGGVYVEGKTVSAAFSCATTSPATITSCSGSVANGAAIDTTTIGTHHFSVAATDSNGVTTTETLGYTVVAPPAVTITTPAGGALFLRGQSVNAAFQCSVPAPDRIEACSATTAQGTPIDTRTVGQHQFTITATDVAGVSEQLTVVYTVVAPRPTISGLRQLAASWVERRRAGAHERVGTRFSFSLDQPAKVTLAFARSAGGRLAGGRCVAPALAGPRARSCLRRLGAGTVAITASAGANAIPFSGITSAGRLPPGTYTVVLRATGLSRQTSTPVSLRFTIGAP